MARHNRAGQGEDQYGHEFTVSYQPDWLHQVKVTRDLETGRQSTKTLFRNPDPAESEPGSRVRTGISAPELGLAFQLALDDPRLVVRRITIEAVIPDGPQKGETILFSITRQRSRTRATSASD